MNKNLLLTIFLTATAITGVLYKTQGNQTETLGQYKYINEFRQFVHQFQRIYSAEEYQTRFEIFSQNMQIINEQNDLYHSGKSTYFLGLNHISDLTTSEFKKYYLGYNAEQQEQEEEQVEDLSEIYTQVQAQSVDWVAKGAVNEVKNQGRCGSCWAFSSIGAVESLSAIKGNGLRQFSEQALMDCSTSYGNHGCNGGLMNNAFKYLAVGGVASESSYPYTAKDGTCSSFTSIFKNKSYKNVMKFSDYFFVKALNVNPVSVAIEADQKSFQLYKGGIYNDKSCGTKLDHGVLAVGYGQGYYTIRNSWGPTWGAKGYIQLARTGEFSPGTCGVQLSPSYPI